MSICFFIIFPFYFNRETPLSADQKLLAKAIVTILPCWKYSVSTLGIVILNFILSLCELGFAKILIHLLLGYFI